jgi:hypothetical protein
MAHSDSVYHHGDLVLKQSVHRDSVGSTSIHSLQADSPQVNISCIVENKLGEKLRMKIENIKKSWMYNWILSFQDLESWYHQKQTESARSDSDRGLSSIFTFKGGKSHTLKKIREKAHELQTKMVALLGLYFF